MMNPNALLIEQADIVSGLPPITPSSSVPDYVCLKNYQKLGIIIHQDNGATVTGSAITLLQAQAVANTGEKALAFTKVYKKEDLANTTGFTETAVSSNTFTTLNTDNVNNLYYIEVDPASLDVANGFDCVRLGTGNGVNTVTSVVYVLWPAKYAKSTVPTSTAD